MSFQPFISRINLSDSIASFSPLSMPNFSFSYSLPSFGNIWMPSSASVSLPSYGGLFTAGLPVKSSNAYDFSFLENPVKLSALDGQSSKSIVPGYPERIVTPGAGGKYKRPASFKSKEAERLWGAFSSKASQFNPKTDLGPEFLNRVKEIANKIDCDYRDLLSVMQAESGLNPYIPNLAGYGAYGLIQFQPNTLRGLGYSPEQLLSMSPVEQLDIVEKHFIQAKKSAGLKGKLSSGEVYGLVLAPGNVNKQCLYSVGSRGYSANSAIDKRYGNNNGKIEKSDLAAYMSANRVNENVFLA